MRKPLVWPDNRNTPRILFGDAATPPAANGQFVGLELDKPELSMAHFANSKDHSVRPLYWIDPFDTGSFVTGLLEEWHDAYVITGICLWEHTRHKLAVDAASARTHLFRDFCFTDLMGIVANECKLVSSNANDLPFTRPKHWGPKPPGNY